VSGAPELWRYGLHLQEETQAALVSLAAELGGREWRELVDSLRNDAPERRWCGPSGSCRTRTW
jgi:hypothetical protein